MRLTRRDYLKKILTASMLFYALSGLASVLNYLFYPLIARYVSVGEYGEIQFLTTMFTQLSVGFVVLNILSIIASVRSASAHQEKNTLNGLNLVSIFVTFVVVALGILILVLNMSSLELSSKSSILILGLGIIASAPYTISLGKLQGNNMFVTSGVIGVLVALLKVGLSLVLVMAGFGVAGAILGITTSILIGSLLIKFIELRKGMHIKAETSRLSLSNIQLLAPIKKSAFVLLFTIITITLLSTMDSIVSRIALDQTDAGHYASVATVAKITLAVTSPLMWLAIPPAVRLQISHVLRFILLASLIAAFATLLFCIFPDFFTSSLIGVSAAEFLKLMPIAAISMLFCAISFILLSATICMGQLKLSVLSTVLASLIFIGVVALSHSSDLLRASLFGQLLASLSFVALLLPPIIKRSKLQLTSVD